MSADPALTYDPSVVRDPNFVKKNRATISHRLAYTAKNPDRVLPHVQRSVRDAWLRIRARCDHLAYYRAVMKSDTARNPEAAVGSRSHKSWLAIGEMQFAYLRRHGLRPGHTMLEIGCGNLRAGRLFIEYLDEGHYTGVEISPAILAAAERTIEEYGAPVEAEEHHVLNEDFYYRTETLVGLAASCGLRAQLMEDWERLRHDQSKIRIVLPVA
jgi:SAM-dependent methyltransferase